MTETLQAQIQALNCMKLIAVQTTSNIIIDETNAWDAHGLLQQNSTQRIDGSGLPMNDLHQLMSPHVHGSVPAVTSTRATIIVTAAITKRFMGRQQHPDL